MIFEGALKSNQFCAPHATITYKQIVPLIGDFFGVDHYINYYFAISHELSYVLETATLKTHLVYENRNWNRHEVNRDVKDRN